MYSGGKKERNIIPETALLRAREITRKVARCITYKSVLSEKKTEPTSTLYVA